MSAALVQAYHTLLMVGRYPLAVLFLQMPPDRVDVNVHPTKAEVRFRDREAVFRAVGRAARRALLAHTSVPEIDRLSQQLRWQPGWGAGAAQPERQPGPEWEMAGDERGVTIETGGAQPVAGEQQALPAVSIPLLRLVGQVALAYLVAEGPDGLYLIDQHAAHERVLFERFQRQRAASVASQTLLQPAAVDLPAGAARLLEEQLPLLGPLGFQVEPFGRGSFLVRAIPALLAGMDPVAALRVLVEDFEEDESPLEAEAEARIIARVCKQAAVKAGQMLSVEEQQALLRDLEACHSPRTCPHGRPTMIHLSVDLLARQFGRKGAR